MTKRIGALLLAATGVLSAQIVNTAAPASGAGEPLLGFALNTAQDHLYKVLGTGRHPRFGSSLLLPPGIRRIYLPPLQHFVLLEDSDGILSALPLPINGNPAAPIPLTLAGAYLHPDAVVFSPSGASAAIYSRVNGKIQVLTGFPNSPQLVRELGIGEQIACQLAISDDAELLVAQCEQEIPYYSREGQAWQPIQTGFRPRAWLFLPRRHDLLVSDAVLNEIVLFSGLGTAATSTRTITHDVAADRLAATGDADEVIAVSSATGTVWEIPLAAEGRFQRVQLANVSTLATLRDGHAFLFSSFPNLTLLRAIASELHASR